MVYQFKQEQQLSVDLKTAWEFFSSPENLSKITPPKMDFKILNGKPEPMYSGQIIQYRVRPVFNIPLEWVTEITHVKAPFYFVDEQRKGPYKMWHHQHFFIVNNDGVLMKDIVTYEPPLGFFGQLANKILIESEIRKIFLYRRQYLEENFL